MVMYDVTKLNVAIDRLLAVTENPRLEPVALKERTVLH